MILPTKVSRCRFDLRRYHWVTGALPPELRCGRGRCVRRTGSDDLDGGVGVHPGGRAREAGLLRRRGRCGALQLPRRAERGLRRPRVRGGQQQPRRPSDRPRGGGVHPGRCAQKTNLFYRAKRT
eukprot:1196004-Prorocentrum_minimum.AAC.3